MRNLRPRLWRTAEIDLHHLFRGSARCYVRVIHRISSSKSIFLIVSHIISEMDKMTCWFLKILVPVGGSASWEECQFLSSFLSNKCNKWTLFFNLNLFKKFKFLSPNWHFPQIALPSTSTFPNWHFSQLALLPPGTFCNFFRTIDNLCPTKAVQRFLKWHIWQIHLISAVWKV